MKTKAEKLRHLTTTETRRPLAEIAPTPGLRGPSTSDLDADMKAKGLSPLQYLVKFGLAEEWAACARAVAARVATEPTHIWEACNKCGRVFTRRYRDRAGRPCISCNFPGYEDGGFMKDMTPAAVKAYQAAMAKAEAETRARERQAELYRVNQARLAEGRNPWTLAELEAHEKTARQRRADDERRASELRAGRDGRMAKAGVLKSPRADAELIQGPAGAPVPKVHRKAA